MKKDKLKTSLTHRPKLTQKCIHGVAQLYPGELKKPVSFGLTPTGHEGIRAIAQAMGLNMSELIEQIGRGQLKIVSESQQTNAKEM